VEAGSVSPSGNWQGHVHNYRGLRRRRDRIPFNFPGRPSRRRQTRIESRLRKSHKSAGRHRSRAGSGPRVLSWPRHRSGCWFLDGPGRHRFLEQVRVRGDAHPLTASESRGLASKHPSCLKVFGQLRRTTEQSEAQVDSSDRFRSPGGCPGTGGTIGDSGSTDTLAPDRGCL